MARASYLVRREGRYYLQIRCAPAFAALLGKPLFRASLRTCEYRRALVRLNECLRWIHPMNDSDSHLALIAKNVNDLRAYVMDIAPITEDVLQARKIYEEALRNMNRRAKAQGFEPEILHPGYYQLFHTFVSQNHAAEEALRERDRAFNYERGRADQLRAVQMGLAPGHPPQQPQHPFSGYGQPAHPVPGYGQPPHPMPGSDQPYPSQPVTSPPSQHAVGPASGWPQAQPQENQGVPSVTFHPAPAPAHPPLPAHAPPPVPEASVEEEPSGLETPLSEALEAYLAERKEAKGHDGERSELGLVIQFIVDEFGDPRTGDITPADMKKLERMLPDIPNREGIPREHCASLSTRYHYAKAHGWKGLHRLTDSRIKNGYYASLRKFFNWMIEKGYHPGPEPKFTYSSDETYVSLPRDSFNDEEILKIFSMPLFTGCRSPEHFWTPGKLFVQNHLYWGYLIALLTGMRPGEIGQLRVADIKTQGSFHVFDLSLFDPTKGRVAKKNLRQFKTASAVRTVPIHPLMIDLGLLERAKDLKEMDCPFLFPEWEPYLRKTGTLEWGRPLAKSWQNLRREIDFSRKNIALYSARHWMADRLDTLTLSERTRHRVLGHSSSGNIPHGYGAKGRYASEDLAELAGLSTPVLKTLSEKLLDAKERAERRELTPIRTWVQRPRWSDYYRPRIEQAEKEGSKRRA